MKHKVISFIAATVITVTAAWQIPTAMASPVNQKEAQASAADKIVQMCAASMTEYRRYGTTKFFEQNMVGLTDEQRQGAMVICYAYSKGYQDGLKWSRIA